MRYAYDRRYFYMAKGRRYGARENPKLCKWVNVNALMLCIFFSCARVFVFCVVEAVSMLSHAFINNQFCKVDAIVFEQPLLQARNKIFEL
jgi:hypothetical protein